MKLYVWDLVIGMHAAVIWQRPATNDQPSRTMVVANEIDVGGGDDADYRAYQFPEAFLDPADADDSYDSDAAALRGLQESMVSTKEPFVCDVQSIDEAKAVILAAMRVRGGIETNCEHMELGAFRCVQSLVESLEGDPMLVSYTLKLFRDAPMPVVEAPEAEALPPGTVANPGLADW